MLSLKLLRSCRTIGRPVQLLVVLTAAFAAAATASAADCQSVVMPVPGATYEITADTATTVRKMRPEFFGFNVEWVEFQLSMWDPANRRVKPDAVTYLSAFPGAVYRYPGGTESNHFEWRNAIGDPATRKTQIPMTWAGPTIAQFGLPEYLNFVQAVGGRPWYVLNLWGSLAGELPSADMVREAGAVAAYFHQQTLAGEPAMMRYELGNELDRLQYMWRPEKYAEVAGAAVSAVAAQDPNVRTVGIAQDYDASWAEYRITASAYDTYVGQALKGKTSEFASHFYYDRVNPVAPTVPNRLQWECKTINDLTQGLGGAPGIWVTEHAKVPEGTAADPEWSVNWVQTADLSAAISVSDMLIGLSQIPAVNGAFTHDLHALGARNGPWPMFHATSTGGLVPSAVYWGMRTLRDSMLEDLLATRVISANKSAYAGGYDVRGVALADARRTRFAVWLINRAHAPVRVKLTLPAMANNATYAAVNLLANADPAINNYGGISRVSLVKTSLRTVFDASGQTYVDVPANAVMSLSLAKTIPTPRPTPRHRTLRRRIPAR